MNEYWVMYEDGDDYELTIIPFATGGEVTTFIEEKLNKYAYRPADFRVIQGTELSLKIVHTPIKILLSN